MRECRSQARLRARSDDAAVRDDQTLESQSKSRAELAPARTLSSVMTLHGALPVLEAAERSGVFEGALVATAKPPEAKPAKAPVKSRRASK